jgi:hypothetical protein
MTRHKDQLEEFARRRLSPLRHATPPDPQVMASIKQNYLRQGEIYRKEQGSFSIAGKNTQSRSRLGSSIRFSPSWTKALAGAFLALVILVGSSATVFGAQGSLPGEPLYGIKSLTEDIRLKIATSPQSKLDLTLDFTNRRVREISSLMEDGKTLPLETSERLKEELENVLMLAAQLDDARLKNALGRIKNLAQDQGMTMAELIDILPDQAEPAITHLQQRLQEQVELSKIGEKDPKTFRFTMRERHAENNKPNFNNDNPGSNPPSSAEDQDNPGQGNGGQDNPSDEPGQDGMNSGNGDHIPNTPKP